MKRIIVDKLGNCLIACYNKIKELGKKAKDWWTQNCGG